MVFIERVYRLSRFTAVLGFAALSLFGLALATDSENESEETVSDQFSVLDWSGYNRVKPLEDGTFLHHYVAETRIPEADDAQNSPTTVFRISFLPRFQCSPLIDVIGTLPTDLPSRARVEKVKEFNRMSIVIDGEQIDFPTLVELRDDGVHGYYNAALERRMTLRILLELGNRLEIFFDEKRSDLLSLLGSRRALETALGRCKNHQ